MESGNNGMTSRLPPSPTTTARSHLFQRSCRLGIRSSNSSHVSCRALYSGGIYRVFTSQLQHSLYAGATEVISAGMPDLTSPSQHVAPFQPSPCYSADGDEYDLASPVALPDTPDASHTYVSRWESAPDLRYDDDDDACYGDVAPQRATRVPSLSVSKRDQRTPSSPPGAFLRNPRISPTRRLPSASARSSAATGAHQPQVQQQQPASVPKRKVKHGGIYSLLLKNRSGEQDQPVLVDEKRSPEVPEGNRALHCRCA